MSPPLVTGTLTIRVPLDCGNHLVVLGLGWRTLTGVDESVDALVQPDDIAG